MPNIVSPSASSFIDIKSKFIFSYGGTISSFI